jgi:hypothetical protein
MLSPTLAARLAADRQAEMRAQARLLTSGKAARRARVAPPAKIPGKVPRNWRWRYL